jgi:hypothetical protein
MAKTAAQIEALKNGIQSWLEKHELAHDQGWRDLDPKVKSEYENPEDIPCLTLWFEGPLYKIFHPITDDVEEDAWLTKRREEFDALVAAHGFWYDFEDSVTISIRDDRSSSST